MGYEFQFPSARIDPKSGDAVMPTVRTVKEPAVGRNMYIGARVLSVKSLRQRRDRLH
jgi:hypothetical protein